MVQQEQQMMNKRFLGYVFRTRQIAGLFIDTNHVFGVSDLMLRIDLEGGDGDIELRVQE